MTHEKFRIRLKTRQLKSKLNFDIHCGHELKHLIGDSVVMLTAGKWKPAEVTRRHDTPRSYVVQTSDGRKYRRNRKHLRRQIIVKIRKETIVLMIKLNCTIRTFRNLPLKETQRKLL